MPSLTTAQKIEILFPAAGELQLELRLGPCRVHVSRSDGPQWITGTYDDPTGLLPIETQTGGVLTTISQRFDPAAAFTGAAIPRLDLAISRERAFALEVKSGASETAVDLGGLPLSRLILKAGASRFDVDFSEANPTEMSLMEIATGAGAFNAKHLANANFATLRFSGGVAACAVDFSGTLRRDATARMSAGLGSLDLTFAQETAARIRSRSFAAATHAAPAFVHDRDSYLTPASARGAHPALDIEVSLAFGALNLRLV